MPDNPVTNVISSMNDTIGMFNQNLQDKNAPPIEWTMSHGEDGTRFSAEMDAQQAKIFTDTMKNYAQVVDAYQQEIGRLNAQQKQISANPILNVLATLGGNAALEDKRLPPLVRALGATAREMNPTYQELETRKLGVLNQEQTALRAIGALSEAQTRTQQEFQMFKMGEERRQKEEERRQALDKYRIEHDEKMAQLAKEKLEAEERMRKAAADSAERRQAERDKTMIEATEIRERAMMSRFEAGQEAAAKKAVEKQSEVPKTVPEKLANLSAAEKSLDNIESKIDKYKDYIGPAAGRTLGNAAPYIKRDVSAFMTNLKLEVAQTIKSTGAGARGFGPQERGFFESLATDKNMTPEKMLGVIDAWRQYIQQNRGALADAYQGLSDPKYRKAFGRDAETIFGEAKETETRRKAPDGAWWVYKDGKWQKE